MQIWFDTHGNKPFSFVHSWKHMSSVNDVICLVAQKENTDDFVNLINIEVCKEGEDLAEKLAAFNGLYQVLYHGGAPSDRMKALSYNNHWDRKVMDARTADIIMILKGNHNLYAGLTKDLPDLGDYYQEIALYLSDECGVPFQYYIHDKATLQRVIMDATFDFIKCCDNPTGLMQEYYSTKTRLGNSLDDAQCWAAALVTVDVRNNGKYINGFNHQNTKPYERRDEFYW